MSVNAMHVSAGRALAVLKKGWDMQCAGHALSWMMHGRPGVGKTQVVEALAKHIGGRLYDVRLTQIDTADLRGLPYFDHSEKVTRWYRPEDLPESEAPAVLFLDELTAASPMLHPTVYGLLQERRVGMHRLPDNTIIVAAGNLVDDGAVAYEMGSALSDRLVHMVVEAEPEDWLKGYAVVRALHPAVTAFIKSRPDLLETLEATLNADQVIAATPRSWERVSHILTHVDDRDLRAIMIAGTVGNEVAAEFLRAVDDIASLVDIEALVATPRSERSKLYPHSLYGLNGLIFGLVGYLNAETLGPVVECTLDIGDLGVTAPDASRFAGVPLRELATAGFEMLVEKAFRLELASEIGSHPAYVAYRESRVKQGLS